MLPNFFLDSRIAWRYIILKSIFLCMTWLAKGIDEKSSGIYFTINLSITYLMALKHVLKLIWKVLTLVVIARLWLTFEVSPKGNVAQVYWKGIIWILHLPLPLPVVYSVFWLSSPLILVSSQGLNRDFQEEASYNVNDKRRNNILLSCWCCI